MATITQTSRKIQTITNYTFALFSATKFYKLRPPCKCCSLWICNNILNMRIVKDQHHPHCGYALKMGLMDNWWRWLFSGIVRTFKERRTHPRTALSMSVLGSLECRLFWHRPPLIFLFNLILGNISSIVIIMRFPTEKWVMIKSGAQKLWENCSFE